MKLTALDRKRVGGGNSKESQGKMKQKRNTEGKEKKEDQPKVQTAPRKSACYPPENSTFPGSRADDNRKRSHRAQVPVKSNVPSEHHDNSERLGRGNSSKPKGLWQLS